MNRRERRIERAETLARQYPISAELLHFYSEITRFQNVAAQSPSAHLEPLLALIRRTVPDPMAAQPRRAADPMHAFFTRVLQQVWARPRTEHSPDDRVCPACMEKPVAAVLRPDRAGSRRFLVCSRCTAEWEWDGPACANCGESDYRKLSVHASEEFAHVSVEACDTCRVYLKVIDGTRDDLVVPEVDELASIPLDLWAAGQGYTKLQVNLFGI